MCVGVVPGPKARPSASNRREIAARAHRRRRNRRRHPSKSVALKRNKNKSQDRAGIERPDPRLVAGRSGQEQGAMAPALTQATPHQRCCPVPNGTDPLALLHHHPTPKTRLAKKAEKWSDVETVKRTRKCSGARSSVTSERSNSYKARLRHSSSNLSASHQEESHCASASASDCTHTNALDDSRNKSPDSSEEIARSEELSSSRGGGEEPVEDPPVKEADPPPPAGVNGSVEAPTGAATHTTGAMGLEPTAGGDRMEIDSPPLPAESPRKSSTDAPDVAIDDDILDVIKSMEPLDMDLTAAEQQLLHEAAAAVMDEHQPVANSAPPPPSSSTAPTIVDKEAEVERRLAEVRSKQQAIETRCQTLLKRASRMQSRHVSRHVADQVAHFVAYAKETLSIGVKGRSHHANGVYGWAEDGRLPTREEVRNIPTATLVNLVSRLQAPPVSYLSNRRYFGLPSKSNGQPSVHHQRPGVQLSSQVAENLEEVAGLWEAQLRYLQRHDDPDATESSSGGESEDETIDPVPAPVETPEPGVNPAPAVKPVSTYQRAAWRWARDRAAVAARWSWLQAQVSDLEYRIRQHTDVYRQLRAAKGAVHFAAPNGVPTPSTSSSSSPTKQAEIDENGPEACSSSRTRPLANGAPATPGGSSSGGFRHRRLIRASQVQSGRKSSRHASSTVRCCCVMSRIYNPCVLCNGKNNYLLPVDPDGMTLRERVGLTDRGFHPVLSLDQDIPLSAHVDSLLKSGDWRPPPPPASAANSSTANRSGLSSRRSSSKLHDDDSVASGSSIKRKANGTNKRKKEDAEGIKERRKSLTKRRRKHLPSADAMDDDSQSYPSSPFGDGSAPAIPGRAGLPSRGSVLQDMLRRRTSYDIDNIVIPYSMAATTRVERLQYKEIQTPKWRIIHGVPASMPESSDEAEDVSEEACQARHDRSEDEERKKFMSYLKQPAGLTRGRRRVDQIDRMDSRAEHSSGANTPDPMSPFAPGSKTADNEDGEESNAANTNATVSEMEGPPPTTPTPVSAFVAAAVKERRRTASLTKRDSVSRFIQDDNSGMSWDADELIRNVAPYEPRQFPLPDAIYQQLLDEMPGSDEEEELIGGIVIEARPKRETRSSESCSNAAAPGGSANHAPAPQATAAGATPTTTTSSVDDEPVAFMSESSGSPAPDELDADEDDPDWEASSQSSVTRTAAKRR